jgi:hypothetical protein
MGSEPYYDFVEYDSDVDGAFLHPRHWHGQWHPIVQAGFMPK